MRVYNPGNFVIPLGFIVQTFATFITFKSFGKKIKIKGCHHTLTLYQAEAGS